MATRSFTIDTDVDKVLDSLSSAPPDPSASSIVNEALRSHLRMDDPRRHGPAKSPAEVLRRWVVGAVPRGEVAAAIRALLDGQARLEALEEAARPFASWRADSAAGEDQIVHLRNVLTGRVTGAERERRD